jgi:hypothetical protein
MNVIPNSENRMPALIGNESQKILVNRDSNKEMITTRRILKYAILLGLVAIFAVQSVSMSFAATDAIHIVKAVPLPASFSGAVFNPSNNYTYLISGYGSARLINVTIWNSANKLVKTLTLGSDELTRMMFYVPISHEVWIYGQNNGFYVVQGLKFVKVISLPANLSGGGYSGSLYNPSNGYIYFTTQAPYLGVDRIDVFNGATNSFVTTINFEPDNNYYPAGMILDPVNHGIYVSNPTVNTNNEYAFVAVIQGTSVVAKISTPYRTGFTGPMIYNPANNRIYIFDNSPKGQLAVMVNPTTNKIVSTLTLWGVFDFDFGGVSGSFYSPASKNLYVVSTGGWGGEDGYVWTNITMINSVTNAVTYLVNNAAWFVPPGSGVIFNPKNNDIYFGAVTTPYSTTPPPNVVVKAFSTATNSIVTTLNIRLHHYDQGQQLLFNPANGYVYDFTQYKVNNKVVPSAVLISSA